MLVQSFHDGKEGGWEEKREEGKVSLALTAKKSLYLSVFSVDGQCFGLLA